MLKAILAPEARAIHTPTADNFSPKNCLQDRGVDSRALVFRS